ncbi:MAG: hypothetical protein U1F67_04420 [Rubrivivax sp.]
MHGLYAPSATDAPVAFVGTATVTVDFATRTATLVIGDTVKDDGSNTPVPAAMTSTLAVETGEGANHLGGTATGALRAGSALASPVATGTAGPAEIGGVLALSGSGAQAGATLLTGFIARKQ